MTESSVSPTPDYMSALVFVDFRDDVRFTLSVEELLRHLHKQPRYKKPALGPVPDFSKSGFMTSVEVKKLAASLGAAAPAAPKPLLSDVELEVLKVVGTVEGATAQDVAARLGMGIERATFHLDELSRTHQLVNWFGNMDRRVAARYSLTHEGRRLLVERGVFK